MASSVRWTRRAKRDFSTIKDFFDQRNGSSDYSKKLFDRICETMDLVRLHDELGEKWKSDDVRFIVVEKYQVFYQVKKSVVRIITIWDARRDPDKLKLP